jgi:hypothetical protein
MQPARSEGKDGEYHHAHAHPLVPGGGKHAENQDNGERSCSKRVGCFFCAGKRIDEEPVGDKEEE